MSLLNSEQGATEVTMMELATEGLQKRRRNRLTNNNGKYEAGNRLYP